ncbi:YihY/virulence factor BrkB family protein [Bombilactobacillus folatiphilus]|uniref:YihY/virulence factor BrkB family protein n=1 Tax=Bombilactobacillus folatiphilus TaxID=2923362 RepID=A0ABY4P7Y7_9LACO|nr:YihY/virulence factor BrkB family protein [Bombilactobacillus folatiphilus]UQS81758.1 YihY/virulence factor BrkB family protein [Bombilactobacillus folatiphilus]
MTEQSSKRSEQTPTPLFETNLPWWKKGQYFIQLVSQGMKDGDLAISSKAVVYYGLLSFFPLISFVGSILPFFHLDPHFVLTYIKDLVPRKIGGFLNPILVKLLTQKSDGLLSFGIIGTLWSSSGLVNILKRSINLVYGLDNQTIYTKKSFLNSIILRSTAVVFTALFVISLLILSVTLILGQQILDWLAPYMSFKANLFQNLLHWKWPVTAIILIGILLLAYVFLPNSNIKLRYLLPGTFFSALGFSLMTQFFSLYIKYFGGRWNSYGTIGTFFILILWMNFIAYIFLIGAAINAAMTRSMSGELVKSVGIKRLYHK